MVIQEKLFSFIAAGIIFLQQFSVSESAVERDGGLWPSCIRVDYGVENTAVCDAVVAVRGEGRGSFISGSSTRNQRIERL